MDRTEPTAAVPPDAWLLEQFRLRRDETAFRSLYRGCTPRLYALALRLVAGAPGDAQELVQEAWVRAVERLDHFRGDSRFGTWLSGILINCYRERGRRASRAPQSLEAVEEAALVDASAPVPGRGADAIDVERAIARLSDGYREVLVLHDVEGHTHREIAGLLGIEEGTSKSQLARGRARLRELLSAGTPPPGQTRATNRGST